MTPTILPLHADEPTRGSFTPDARLRYDYSQASIQARNLACKTDIALMNLPQGAKNEAKSAILKSRADWSRDLASWAGSMSRVCASCDLTELHALLDTAATSRAALVESDSMSHLAKNDHETFSRVLFPSYQDSRYEAFRRVVNAEGTILDDHPGAAEIVAQFWDIGRGSE